MSTGKQGRHQWIHVPLPQECEEVQRGEQAGGHYWESEIFFSSISNYKEQDYM